MSKKLLITVCMFFSLVLQGFITTSPFHSILNGIQFDFKFFAIIIIVLSALRIFAIIYFVIMLVNWVNSDFKLKMLLPCILSLITIFCIDYSIKTIIKNKIKRIQNKIQNIPNTLYYILPFNTK